jgi:hypothetical protein
LNNFSVGLPRGAPLKDGFVLVANEACANREENTVMKFSTMIRRHLVSAGAGLLSALLLVGTVEAQETVCARVKIEIKQELALERQGFEAEMRINNALDNASLTEVDIAVRVTEENGAAVPISTDPNDVSAKFFIRVTNKQLIDDISGNGTVAPLSTAVIDWLLIPAPGAAGTNPLGKKYLVGATLTYKFGGETHTLDVSPDVITVKPLPLLTLDYFLTKDVVGDDPMTAAVEPPEPFTLGVRIKNTGMAVAKGVKIDSAQPKIVENTQGLAINFRITGSYVNDAPASNTLLINFGDIASNTARMGRWIMESTLAGQFVEFTATFSHADELGGAMTSILQATNAHFLIHDVRVDLPGRDLIRDFLAQDGDVIRVYESEGADSTVTDQSAQATLVPAVDASGLAVYRMTMPATQGFVYVRLPDPYGGTKTMGTVMRADAKAMPMENVWFSRTKNRDTGQWQFWINFFDANTPGVYDVATKEPAAAPRPPVLQFVPDRIVKEGQQLSFLVEASSPDGRPVTLSAAPLPLAAKFNDQGGGRAVFDWTPSKGQAGSYPITFTASDGKLTATQAATIKVETAEPPPGPATPTVDSPLSGAQVASLKPTLKVLAGQAGNDPTLNLTFELYSDAAMTQKVAEGVVVKNPTAGQTTDWQVPVDLNDNTWYWWRARAYDGSTLYSQWANGRFFANLFNDAPEPFNLTVPAPGAEVGSLTPELSLTNSIDKDGDAITYSFRVFADAGLTQVVAQADGVLPGDGGITTWIVVQPLSNHGTYYWRAIATDANGAQTQTPARTMTVNTGNTAPTAPQVLSPTVSGQSTSTTAALTVQSSTDAENDALTYSFEIDVVPTFDSGNRKASGPMAGGAGAIAWSVSDLVENQRYHWRAKAFDGRAESGWTTADFLMNAVNEAPPLPTVKNPGAGAWVATQVPTLEANPVLDPEGDAVLYRFEVYTDAGLNNRSAAGVSTTTQWVPPVVLADKTTHYWRLRAEDGQGAASAWSVASVLYVSGSAYAIPTIAVTSPAVPTDGRSGKVTIRWEGTDPNIDPNIALYYDRSGSGYAGVRIVDGIKQSAGTVSGTYEWDVSTLPSGTYYVYAVIYDAKGAGKAYAPGAVVIPNPAQAGGVAVKAKQPLRTDEKGKQATFTVRLTKAPTKDVSIGVSSSDPSEGKPAPETLTFTPTNWSTPQTVTVTGQEDCARDGREDYKIILGQASSLDPDYIGVKGAEVTAVNEDKGDAASRFWTNNRNIAICNYRQLSKQKVERGIWEYAFEARLTNVGPALSNAQATISRVLPTATIVDGVLDFGAVGSGETVKSRDTFVLRTRHELPANFSPLIIWKVNAK